MPATAAPTLTKGRAQAGLRRRSSRRLQLAFFHNLAESKCLPQMLCVRVDFDRTFRSVECLRGKGRSNRAGRWLRRLLAPRDGQRRNRPDRAGGRGRYKGDKSIRDRKWLRAGQADSARREAARITFFRTTEKTCGTEVVFPSLNIRRPLPLNQPVVMEFTPRDSGEIGFGCGMNM